MLDDASARIASFKALFENVIFLSTLLSLCIAQVLKGVIYALNGRKRKTRELLEIVTWRTGGMPSSHSAVVCSLCTSVAFVEGFSNLFIVSFWFALVVLRDAMGVRRSAGLLAKGLNSLGKIVTAAGGASARDGVEFHAVKEVQGHTPLEVVIGGLLGVFIAAGLYLF